MGNILQCNFNTMYDVIEENNRIHLYNKITKKYLYSKETMDTLTHYKKYDLVHKIKEMLSNDIKGYEYFQEYYSKMTNNVNNGNDANDYYFNLLLDKVQYEDGWLLYDYFKVLLSQDIFNLKTFREFEGKLIHYYETIIGCRTQQNFSIIKRFDKDTLITKIKENDYFKQYYNARSNKVITNELAHIETLLIFFGPRRSVWNFFDYFRASINEKASNVDMGKFRELHTYLTYLNYVDC